MAEKIDFKKLYLKMDSALKTFPMKKILILIFALQLFSCAPVQFKELKSEFVPKYKDKIYQISKTHIVYKSDGSIHYKTKSIETFDYGNNCIALVEDYGTRKCYGEYIYENGLLKQINYKFSDSASTSVKMDYDKLSREIYYQFCEDNFCYHHKTYYDEKSNVIKKEYFEGGKLSSTELYTINYKNNIVKIESLKDSGHHTQTVRMYDKKGNIIKSQTNSKERGLLFLSEYKYDDDDKMVKHVRWSWDSQNKHISTFKYYLDKKGNLIKLEHFVNDKLFELTTYDITYR